jgi:hypothetical protein
MTTPAIGFESREARPGKTTAVSEQGTRARRRSGGWQFNRRVDPAHSSYERPPLWRRNVAPGRVLFPAYLAGLLLVLLVQMVLGVSDRVAFYPALAAAFIAQGAADLWWRQNRAPAADRPYRRLISRPAEDHDAPGQV